MKRYYRIRFERSAINDNICAHIILPRRTQKTRRNHILIIEFTFTGFLRIPNSHKRITILKSLNHCWNNARIDIEKEKQRYLLKIPSHILEGVLDHSLNVSLEFKEVIKNYEYYII